VWDFIIVGAGTAGCVLAHELSASGRHKVLLIEAGGKPPLMSRIPAGMPKLFGTRHDWQFRSEPNRSCGDRRIYIPRGRMLGGCASINAQIHQWCHPADFDEWAADGARGWGWTDVAPVFRAMEALAGTEAGAGDDQSRGGCGPMRVEVPRSESELPRLWVEAARAAGLTTTGQYNGSAYRGAWLTEQAHHRGARFSVHDAFLKPALARPNLSLLTGCTAERLLVEGQRAAGVVLDNGRSERAAGGVILAAGAYGSPHLLMRSGVGPGAHLRDSGVAVTLDCPAVGENLQEHALLALSFHLKRPISLKRAGSIGQLLRWLVFRRGLLATSGIDAFAFESTDGGPANLELILAPFEVRDQLRADPGREAYAIASAVLKPRSRGSVRLSGPRAGDAPVIDLNLFSDPGGVDRAVVLAGLKLARRIVATEPLACETADEFAETAGIDGDEALFAAALPTLQTVYHPAGTCRMGTGRDAVLDAQLRVHGLEGLRVIDASAMPSVPRGHPNAVVAMMAKRGAGMVLAG
jgi:choline dehydrogenase